MPLHTTHLKFDSDQWRKFKAKCVLQGSSPTKEFTRLIDYNLRTGKPMQDDVFSGRLKDPVAAANYAFLNKKRVLK